MNIFVVWDGIQFKKVWNEARHKVPDERLSYTTSLPVLSLVNDVKHKMAGSVTDPIR